MSQYKPVSFALFTTFALASAAQAGDTVQTPRTAAARAAGDLIARVERAITGYVAACGSRDEKRLSDLTTDDVRVEFTLDQPGAYLTLSSEALMASCVPGVTPPAKQQMWVFPTNDADAVFVQYEVSGISEATTRQLALVEMRGEQIARMRNFAPISSTTVASATLLPAATPCAALTDE